MKICEVEYEGSVAILNPSNWLPENVIEIEKRSLRRIVDKICQGDGYRYPLLALRVLLHIITDIDTSGRVQISARQLSRTMNVHYDTVTKCLKYLREIEVLRLD